MKNNVLEMNFEKIVNCNAEIAKWNYWDQEHLDVVHGGYTSSDMLYESKNFLFKIDGVKIPLVPFLKSNTPIFMVQHDEKTLFTFALQFGVLSKTTITMEPINREKCKVKMNYKFFLNGWRKILKPILKKLIPIWNEKVWLEDLPVKLRRQKMIDLNFKDFYGLPNRKEDRVYKGNIKTELPLKRPKESIRDQHPLKKIN